MENNPVDIKGLNEKIATDKVERQRNKKEFEESYQNKQIKPRSKYNYSDKNEIFWWWNDETNQKPIEMTVAMPVLRGEKIIWLALESLKNQINVNFAWELICYEENAKSRSIIQSYVGILPGCVRIVHKNVHPSESIYKINRFTLLEKWVAMAKLADKDSTIFVKQACDDYSSPKRLFIHYEHFKNPKCYYSTQPCGYFYNIFTKKYFLYNGIIRDIKSKKKGCHLNMALRIKYVKNITLPVKPLLSSNDNFILTSLLSQIKLPANEIIFYDNIIDKDNWKQSLATDGYNIISTTRRKFYDVKTVSQCIPVDSTKIKLNIPKYVLDRLNLL